MSEIEQSITLRDLLLRAAEEGIRLRFYNNAMVILAEGFVSFIGNGVIGITHKKDCEADEYLLECSLAKVQKLAEYAHY